MNGAERALLFACGGETLVGMLSVPARPRETALLVVVGGPQYRAGSHRQFVLLARRLAAEGYAALRFDCRGMGDSSGDARDFESVSDDIGAAVDALLDACPGVRRVVLWGLCDGASASLLYLHDTADRRIAGLCLINPWVRSQASLARTHVKHYYAQRLRQPEFWRKLLTGGVAGQALQGLLANLRLAGRSPAPAAAAAAEPFQTRMARAWGDFRGAILLVLSGDDYTAREFGEYVAADPAWRGRLQRQGVERCDVAGADHTFSDTAMRQAAESATVAWLLRQWPGRAAPSTALLESTNECS